MKKEEVQEAAALAVQISDDAEIQDAFKKMLLQNDDEQRLRKRYDRLFNKNHPKHQAYKLALNTYLDLTEREAQQLLLQADSLLDLYKKSVGL